MKTLQLNVPDQLEKELQIKAIEMNTDVNVLIVNAVEKFFFMTKVEELRKDIKENYNSSKWQSEEDVFNDIS